MAKKECKHCSPEGICLKISASPDRLYKDKPYYCGVTDARSCVLYEGREGGVHESVGTYGPQ